ncbi:MAG: thermostable hemolysin delta-VPH [Clostridia bacterium]|nr:thermostable hemolysin delta-VPH [Clostridia bacterium]
MGYFNYHSKIQKKINNGEFEYFEIVDEYNGISPCMLLHFSDGKIMPIREHMFDEYLKIISKLN